MNCPKCNGKLRRKHMDFLDSCLSTILIEFAFWMTAGILALFLSWFISSITIIVSAGILLIVIAHLIDRKYSVRSCESCDSEFKLDELKL